MKRTFSIVFGIAILVLPTVSVLIIISGQGWLGMKILGLWTIVATIYAIKG